MLVSRDHLQRAPRQDGRMLPAVQHGAADAVREVGNVLKRGARQLKPVLQSARRLGL